MTIGQRIKDARKQARLTQEDLGKKLGVSASFIAQYETNNRNPKIETLQRIASALGVPLETLTGVSGETWARAEQQIMDTSSPSILGEPPTQAMRRALGAMGELNPEGQERVADYAEDLEASGRYKKRGASGMGKEA